MRTEKSAKPKKKQVKTFNEAGEGDERKIP